MLLIFILFLSYIDWRCLIYTKTNKHTKNKISNSAFQNMPQNSTRTGKNAISQIKDENSLYDL